MEKNNLLKKMRKKLISLDLADSCLIIFMAILMFQSAYDLFFHETGVQNNNSIDIIVRTTAAAIFGYFISVNFQSGVDPEQDDAANISIMKPTNTDNLNLQNGHKNSNENKLLYQRDRLQIVVVSTIGLSSLLMMIIAHDYFIIPISSIPTLSQLRDFISGSVGFLIGHSAHKKKQP